MPFAQPVNGQERAAVMRAHLLVRPGVLELHEVPLPVPDPDSVVIRVRAALTCGTDLKTFLRGHPKFAMPMFFGHEFAGEVAMVGTRVKGVREGDEIMAAPTAPCGQCFHCLREQENLCPQVMPTMVHGAYAEYVNLPAHIVTTNLYPKPRGLAYAEAALLEPLACVLHALRPVRLRFDDTVVIVGAGAFALLHLLVLRNREVGRVIVVTRGVRRGAEAARLGADEVITGGAEQARDEVLALTAGRGGDVVIECTGQTTVWEAALGFARPGGQVVLFGGCPSGSVVRFDAGRLHYDQVTILSPFHFTPRDARGAYELLAGGGFNGAALVSGRYPLERLPEALARLQRGEGSKFAIIPQPE
jgi:L-iditol 2-dehydrogenase